MPLALVVVAHPKPGSFAHAMAHRAADALAERGYQVAFHDLYAEGFDPVLVADEIEFGRARSEEAFAAGGDPLVAAHRRELAVADVLVVAHPNWWGKPPGIMAGWLDRVLSPGVAYRFDSAAGHPEYLLDLRLLVVLNTSDTTPSREAREIGDPLEAMWRNAVGGYLPRAQVRRMTAAPIGPSTPAQREEWLAQADRLTRGETETPEPGTRRPSPRT